MVGAQTGKYFELLHFGDMPVSKSMGPSGCDIRNVYTGTGSGIHFLSVRNVARLRITEW